MSISERASDFIPASLRAPARGLRDTWFNYRLRAAAKKKEHDPEQQILIVSSPRSGSTWLAECVAQLPATALLWEPLHLRKVNAFPKIGFGWRQYIPKETAWPEASTAFERLLAGKMINVHIAKKTDTTSLRRAQRLIIKFTRAHALLPWLTHQFSFHFAPLYLIRHPMAVVSSQIRHGAWGGSFSAFEMPKAPYSHELYGPHRDFLETLVTKEEWLTARWCITNLVPLRDPANNKRWITISYERLLLDPIQELARISKRWGIELRANSVRQPSSTADEQSPVRDARKQLRHWRGKFTAAQIERMSRVLNYFEVEHYGEGPLPLTTLSDEEHQ